MAALQCLVPDLRMRDVGIQDTERSRVALGGGSLDAEGSESGVARTTETENRMRRFIVNDAIRFAYERHGDQRYAGQPYSYHLDRVDEELCRFGHFAPPCRAAAFLHDVLEDTTTTREELRERFGSTVEGLVWSCTGIGENRKARNADIATKIMAFPLGAPVKTADRLVNHDTTLRDPGLNFQPSIPHCRMYMAERESFIAMVRPHISSSMLAALKAQYEEMADFILKAGK